VVVLWLGCRCLPSVNTICGRIMIGLSLLLSVSKHNMWSYYAIIIRPHIVFTDGRQRQPNHNTTTYYVYWRTTTNDNPIIISHINSQIHILKYNVCLSVMERNSKYEKHVFLNIYMHTRRVTIIVIVGNCIVVKILYNGRQLSMFFLVFMFTLPW
jgi:hypothetical protein